MLRYGECEADQLTFGQLDRRARRVAARLQSADLCGERAVLVYPFGLDFITAFVGCLYAGVVAVPAYPPLSRRHAKRLTALLKDCRARCLLSTEELSAKIARLASSDQWPRSADGPVRISTDRIDAGMEGLWDPPRLRGRDLAFLQYTSGSTGLPKGVMISHDNILQSQELIRDCLELTPDVLGVGWLPLHHDMGLIGNLLHPIYLGFPMVLMSPLDFIQKPIRWLRAISRYRATGGIAPDFAYDLCVRSSAEADREGLDLSCWKVAVSGGEPIRNSTLERFVEAYGPYGFKAESFLPGYGLAETTLITVGAARKEDPVVRSFDKNALRQGQARLLPSASQAGAASRVQPLVSSGRPLGRHRLRIVDPGSDRSLPPGTVGEIRISGPCVALGYWERPQETQRLFRAPVERGSCEEDAGGEYLRTGDLGFVLEGELYVTGRLKEMIIIRGCNYYPVDFEKTVRACHPCLLSHPCAAFGFERGNGEEAAIVQEVGFPSSQSVGEEVIESIRRALLVDHEVRVSAVVLLEAGSLPRTSAGKLRRTRCRELFLADALPNVVLSWSSKAAQATACSQN